MPPAQHWPLMTADMLQALDMPATSLERIDVTGTTSLTSCYPVTDLAVASVGLACLAVSELIGLTTPAPRVTVDRRLTSLWFGGSIAPVGWTMPPAWDAIAGDYETRDGWIKLHTNAPHHRAAALKVLGVEATREAVARAVRGREADVLEADIVAAGGCAARMRSAATWRTHPQGQAVAGEALIASTATTRGSPGKWRPRADRPLRDIRVLDLTRVLAGPVATRFLAGYGAEVLRIDPPHWDEPGVVPDVTLGKRCARLDLGQHTDRAVFSKLLTESDVVVHGYRAGALEALGFGAEAMQAIRPGLIDVSLNAYGHSGPWAGRRGFDSLVQMSTGIADAGKAWRNSDRPTPLPVQALDHATGYLMAAAVVRGIYARLVAGHGTRSRLSLARTAELLAAHKGEAYPEEHAPRSEADLTRVVEKTPWGPAQRVRPPAAIQGRPMFWDRPASALGSVEAAWLR